MDLVQELLEAKVTMRLFRTVSDTIPRNHRHEGNGKFGRGTYFSASAKSNEMYSHAGGKRFKIQAIYRATFNNLLVLSEDDLNGLSMVDGLADNPLVVTASGAEKLQVDPGITILSWDLVYPKKYDGIYFVPVGDVLIPTHSDVDLTVSEYILMVHEKDEKIIAPLSQQIGREAVMADHPWKARIPSLAGHWRLSFSPSQAEDVFNYLYNFT